MNTRLRSRVAESIFPQLESAYGAIYLTLMIAGTVFVIWYQSAVRVDDDVADSVYATIVGTSYVGVASAAITVAIVEGGIAVVVLARKMLERAMERGREEGKEENQRLWEAWLQRKERADSEGREFNEPPPSAREPER